MTRPKHPYTPERELQKLIASQRAAIKRGDRIHDELQMFRDAGGNRLRTLNFDLHEHDTTTEWGDPVFDEVCARGHT